MAVQIIELAKALVTELSTASGKSFERRYAPYYDREELATAKWVVVLAGEMPALNCVRSRMTSCECGQACR